MAALLRITKGLSLTRSSLNLDLLKASSTRFVQGNLDSRFFSFEAKKHRNIGISAHIDRYASVDFLIPRNRLSRLNSFHSMHGA